MKEMGLVGAEATAIKKRRGVGFSALASALCLLLSACASVNTAQRESLAPEAASGYQAKTGGPWSQAAVATANPLASEAGWAMLQAGGSAIDAAIAAQMVLTLVEPQSSGIGGGAFLLHHDGNKTQAFDGRERAPAAATPQLFLKPDGQVMAFTEAVVGGRSVGTPGVVAMLYLAHQQHGVLPWAKLFEPAIRLAREGFALSPRLHSLLTQEKNLFQDRTAASYFYDDQRQAWPIGHVLKNPELAESLSAIAQHGPQAFYRGAIAAAIVAKVRSHPTQAGTLSLEDLANYRALEREPLCQLWRQYRLCGFPPPSSGAVAIGQILGLLEQLPPAPAPDLEQGKLSTEFLHRYSEASRLAFADRAQYLADPDFVPAPSGRWSSLIEADYLARRARLIGPVSMKTAPPGQPGGTNTSFAPAPDAIEHGTSHISVIDERGRAVAMTTTIEDQFGSRQMVKGFLLNNQLTDFAFNPSQAGLAVANRVEALKRPRSSMSPTLVFDSQQRLLMSAGSPGGALIIHYTAKTLLATLAWGLEPQNAVALPNFGSTNGPTLLEQGRFAAAELDALKARGHDIREIPMTSGIQVLRRNPVTGEISGGADPRREGVVIGR